MFAMIFFSVSGGPWGSEELFAYGPSNGIKAILLMAIFYSFPACEVVAELGSSFPMNGGYSLWVTEAFGPFWGFQESYWSWLGGVTDNALYPVLMFDALKLYFEEIRKFSVWEQYLCKTGLVLVMAVPNLLSTPFAGRLLQLCVWVQALPFAIFVGLGLPKVDPKNLVSTGEEVRVDWWVFLHVVYWNMTGFSCVSTAAGEIEKPSKSLRWALRWTLICTVLQYVVILSVAAGVGVVPWSRRGLCPSRV